jgi:hypothetical protein
MFLLKKCNAVSAVCATAPVSEAGDYIVVLGGHDG